jgi:protein transport protein SEC61 subunit alpha
LNKYISTAAALVGMCVGLLTIFADYMGSIASGSGILQAKI